MDPFTQRMLEKAKIRREKLNSHFAQPVESQRAKSVIENKESEDTCHCSNDGNGTVMAKSDKLDHSNARKMKLQKLALFYAGKKDLSFEKENKEDLISDTQFSIKKPKCKFERLAELTTKINEWEDELNPSRTVLSRSNPKDTCNTNAVSVNVNDKPKIWDPIVDKLSSQGYILSENPSKLVYNFNANLKEHEKFGPKKCLEELSDNVLNSSVRYLQKDSTVNQSNGDEGSKIEIPISSKVAFFENGNKREIKKPNKDPAEMSVAERKALFEHNSESKIKNSCVRSHPSKVSSDLCGEIQSRNITNFKNYKGSKEWDPMNYKSHESSTELETRGFGNLKSSKFLEPETKELTTYKAPEIVDAKDETNKEANLKSPFKEAVTADLPTLVETLPAAKDFEVPKTAKNITENFESESPSKGRLYPSLSNLDVSGMASTFSEPDDFNESKNSNICLNMSLSDLLEMNKNNPITPPSDLSFSKSKECQVLNKMDKLLESAVNDLSSESEDECENTCPSPPKIMKSSSFEYRSTDSDNQALLHTVSFYRKQQQNHFSPEKIELEWNPKEKEESISIENKIEMLLAEVNKQQTIMSQASQALNLCLSTVEFSGSGEQVEGERLLLLAGHKRQACLNEIQRLKVENSVRPREENMLSERGDVTLTNISVKLKRDALRAMAAAENLHYFVCLIKSDEKVFATPVVAATRENLSDFNLRFPGSIKLEELYSNFRVTIEVYSLELGKELLPHEVKYHICNKKEKKLLTPIKVKKMDSKLVKPQVQSPAGPNAVRTSSFQMCGYVVFSLKEVNRTQWILNKVPYVSSLEGTLSMSICSQLRLDNEFRGFLTMFDDISGFGAWHRRWCLLSSHLISYWKYPDDEQKKVPIGTIDLRSVVTDNVGLVSRDICARLNTFLLETTRPRLSEDKSSLVLSVEGDVTTIRHLLSADSKPEMLTWCKKLNTILALLRSWKCNFEG